MHKLWIGSLAALLLTAGCGSGQDNADLVGQRYGDCLAKLHAQQSQALDYYVTYTTDAGFLTFHIAKMNGKTYTLPDKPQDIDILATVGC